MSAAKKIAAACKKLYADTDGFEGGTMSKMQIYTAITKATKVNCKTKVHKQAISKLIAELNAAPKPAKREHSLQDRKKELADELAKEKAENDAIEAQIEELIAAQAKQAAQDKVEGPSALAMEMEAMDRESREIRLQMGEGPSALQLEMESMDAEMQEIQAGMQEIPSAMEREMEAMDAEMHEMNESMNGGDASSRSLAMQEIDRLRELRHNYEAKIAGGGGRQLPSGGDGTILQNEIARLQRERERLAAYVALASSKTSSDGTKSLAMLEIARLRAAKAQLEASIAEDKKFQSQPILDADGNEISPLQAEIQRLNLERQGLMIRNNQAKIAQYRNGSNGMESEMAHLLDELDAVKAKAKKQNQSAALTGVASIAMGEIASMRADIETMQEEIEDYKPVGASGAPSIMQQYMASQRAELAVLAKADQARAEKVGKTKVPMRPQFNAQYAKEEEDAIRLLSTCAKLAELMPREMVFGGDLSHMCRWESTQVPAMLNTLLDRLEVAANASSTSLGGAFTAKVDKKTLSKLKHVANTLSIERDFNLLLSDDVQDAAMLGALLQDWLKELQQPLGYANGSGWTWDECGAARAVTERLASFLRAVSPRRPDPLIASFLASGMLRSDSDGAVSAVLKLVEA